MAGPTGRAPRGTRALVTTIMEALDDISEVSRKSAFRHASATVRDKLIAQSERAKAAARRASGAPGAKRAAAAAAIARSSRRR